MTTSAKRIAIGTFLLTCLTASFALAGPPFITDDPEPVEYKHWEVYIFSIYNHRGGGESSSNASGANNTGDSFAQTPDLEVNYGVIPDVQLHVVAGGAYDRPMGGAAQFGWGDTELGIKYRFIHETDSIPQVGAFPLIEFPTGDANRGLGNGKAQFFFPIWIQKSFGEEKHQWTTYGGGGYWINPGTGHRDFFRLGWLLQRDLGEHVTLGGEIFHETSASHGTSGHTAFNIGGFYNFDDHNHLLLTVGRDIHGPGKFACYLGYQWTFGGD